MNSRGKLLIFSAPSGAGKTTIVKHLLEQYPDLLRFSISATTREARAYETKDKDYYFISVEEFKKRIDEGAFIEYQQVYEGLYYGTLYSEVERLWKENKVVIFDVDVQGGINLKKQFGDDALSIFVKPPHLSELRKRLEGRNTESTDKLNERIEKAKSEIQYEDNFDEVILNDTLEIALQKAEALVDHFISSKA